MSNEEELKKIINSFVDGALTEREFRKKIEDFIENKIKEWTEEGK